MIQLTGRPFNYKPSFYVLTSPNDNDIFASNPYRAHLKEKYDLVLVENGCFLEPNYIIIDNLESDIDPIKIRGLNKLPTEKVKVEKYQLNG